MATTQEPNARASGNGKTPPARKRRGFNVSAWSIDHPWVIIAFYAGIVMLAIVAIFGNIMHRRMMPYVESPMVGIITMMPGLSSQEVERYISMPIEQRMTNIRGVRYIRSTSQDGLSIVSLEFPYGTDMQKATNDVLAIMKATEGDLPQTSANLKPYWVLPIDPLNIPILSLSVTGDPQKGWTPLALRQFAENEAVVAFKQVPDVQSVDVYGGRKRQLQVIVDRDKLAAYGFSILDIKKVIDENSVAAPAGLLTAGPNENIIRVSDLAQNAQSVGNYPLGAKNGQVVYIKDVAQVIDGTREQRSSYEYTYDLNGNKGIQGADDNAVELAIIQNPAAGSPPVIDGVMKEAQQLESDHPGLHFAIAYDNAHFVNILFHNMFEELAVAILLCGVVVLFFLGEWRGTVISLTTIPVSLAMAILLMMPFGFSLNSSTLIGLLLSIGRLVDDSVIDIHAVERHLGMGKDAKTATVDGITEIRLAVAASTLMLVLALLPLVFSGGITQLMFVELAYPIIFGLLASFLVSLTLTAVMAAKLLRPTDALGDQRRGWLMEHVLDPVQNWLRRVDEGYRRFVLLLLTNKFAVVAGAVAVLFIGYVFYNFLGSEMMPLADVGQAYGVLEMQPGASFQQTQVAATALNKILLSYPEVEKVSTEIGEEPGGTYFTGYAMNQVNTATMMITLKDKDARDRTIWQVIDGARDQALKTIPNIRRLQIKEMGSDVMASSEAPIQILVTGPDPNVLSQLANQVADVARKTPGAYQEGTSWAVDKPSYRLDVDARRAAQLGLTPTDVAEQAYYAMGGGLADEFYRLPNVRQDTIDIRYQQNERRDVNDLLQMPITGMDGTQVPLKTLATVHHEMVPSIIEHDGLERSISILAYYRKGGPPSMDLTMAIMRGAFSQVNFPPGYSLKMRGDMTQMMDSFARLLRGLELAILLIFLMLVAQFRGILAPLQMMLALPLELSGVFAGLWIAHQAFSTVSIMAVIVLTGMNITTAILLVDQIMRRRDEGRLKRDDAIAQACADRLRPILMTSLITIITMLPVALAPRTG
ncbi:MAG TPA: efflux RND transporter permease subunit, partial [Capsulimonadaceae bacterium]|nr:efflux RND transporter permease subunit [Capsulimonadaceae bacterium]